MSQRAVIRGESLASSLGRAGGGVQRPKRTPTRTTGAGPRCACKSPASSGAIVSTQLALLDLPERRPHPAKFTPELLAVIAGRLPELCPHGRILDPFAGVGGVHTLGRYGYETFGVELELVEQREVITPKQRHGTNGELRVEGETVAFLRAEG